MDTVKIGKFLSELRREQELTQEQLAEKLGTSNKTISRWENGNYMPPVEMLMELSKFYEEDSSLSLEDRRQYFTKKWKKEHWFTFVIPTLFALALIAFSAALGKIWGIGLGFLVSVAARIISYNMMMGYVERNAFDGKGNDKKS